MTNQPRVSVGLPVYNGENYLELALESLLSQDYEDFELIVCDNASSDRTPAILEAWAQKDERIVLHHNPTNLGGAANFNRVLGLARGEYFRWAGHDDLVAPGMLRACVDRLDEEGPGCVLAYPQTVLIDEDGEVIEIFDNGLHLPQDDPLLRLRQALRNLTLANVIFGLMRTDAIKDVGGIPRYHSGDMVMIVGMALRGRFSEIAEPLFNRRMHKGMSWQASRSPEGFTTWFDPARTPWVVFPVWRVWRELLAELNRAPLSTGQKVRGAKTVATEWPRRQRDLLKREIVRAPGVILGRARSELARRRDPD